MKKIIATSAAPAAIGPYSQAVRIDNTLYVSGQLPVDPKNGEIPSGIEAQTRQSLDNVFAILAEAGMGPDNVAKTCVLLKDIRDFAAMNAIYAGYFPNDKPARVCYQVAELPKGALVEIDAIAAL